MSAACPFGKQQIGGAQKQGHSSLGLHGDESCGGEQARGEPNTFFHARGPPAHPADALRKAEKHQQKQEARCPVMAQAIVGGKANREKEERRHEGEGAVNDQSRQTIEQPADAQARQPDEQVYRRDANSKNLEESRFQIIGARPDLRKEIAELSLAACDPFRSGGNVAGIGREPGMRKKEKEVKRGAKKDNAIPPGKIPGVCALGEVSDQRERLSA